MKRLQIFLALAMVAVMGLTAMTCGYAETPSYASLFDYLRIYCEALPDGLREVGARGITPVVIDCGEVQVTLHELIYDGYWLYSAAAVTPTNPEATLILPGGGEGSDLVCGLYGEAYREDSRTFSDAAAEDGKQLLSVYAYPKNFEGSGFPYFLDYFQLADDVSLLFSGAAVRASEEAETLPVTLQIEVYGVDPDTHIYQLLGRYEHASSVDVLAVAASRQYLPVNEEDALPFTAIDLINSGLTVYVKPLWEKGIASHQFQLVFLDEQEAAIPSGTLSNDKWTLTLAQLPDQMKIKLIDPRDGSERIVTLQAEN